MTTVRASLDGDVIAESDSTVLLEGNHYFPPDSVRPGVLRESDTTSLCPWKGRAHYWTVAVGERTAPDAAWTYRHPSPLARQIKDRVAFTGAVQVAELG
jgi:uncharacterized protein (DUF427 family)